MTTAIGPSASLTTRPKVHYAFRRAKPRLFAMADSPPAREPASAASFAARILVATGLVIAGVSIILCVPAVLFTVIAGILLSIVLRVPARWLCRKVGWPAPLALVVVTLVLLGSTILGLYLLGTRLGEQVQTLLEQLPQSFAAVRAWADKVPWARALLRFGFLSAPPEVSSNKVVAGATSVISRIIDSAVALVAVFFIGIYGAAQPKAYSDGLVRLVRIERRPRVRAVLAEINRSLSRWLAGRILAMASVAVMTAVGLRLAGIPLAIPLGLLAGVFTFVEYLGAVVSAVPALLVALGQESAGVLWVILIFTVAHVVEGYLLTPFITRGSVFGVMGLTFATPVAVIATVIVKKLYVEDYLGDKPNP